MCSSVFTALAREDLYWLAQYLSQKGKRAGTYMHARNLHIPPAARRSQEGLNFAGSQRLCVGLDYPVRTESPAGYWCSAAGISPDTSNPPKIEAPDLIYPLYQGSTFVELCKIMLLCPACGSEVDRPVNVLPSRDDLTVGGQHIVGMPVSRNLLCVHGH